jgi:hypothetical protein
MIGKEMSEWGPIDKGECMVSETGDETQKQGVDVDQYYATSLSEFTNALEQAIATSHQASGHDAGPRRFWASVLFTRLCSIGVSILWLCPQSPVNLDGLHWDFSSLASLVRNLFECALSFFYLGIELVGDEEWQVRLRVMQLHDCMGRLRMFRDFGSSDEQLSGFEAQADELRTHLSSNGYFMSLPDSLRRKLLRGEQASMLTQDEVLHRMGEFEQRTRGYYRFLSSHTHSFPLAFYRMTEHNRGRGEENEVDKGHMAAAIEFASGVLTRTTTDMQAAFKDVVAFNLGKFNWQILRARRDARS